MRAALGARGLSDMPASKIGIGEPKISGFQVKGSGVVVPGSGTLELCLNSGDGGTDGVTGDPRLSSLERGTELLRILADRVADMVGVYYNLASDLHK